MSGTGEPFVDKNVHEVIKISNENALITIMATNVSVLNRDLIIFLKDNNVTVAISLDTTAPNRFAERKSGKN